MGIPFKVVQSRHQYLKGLDALRAPSRFSEATMGQKRSALNSLGVPDGWNRGPQQALLLAWRAKSSNFAVTDAKAEFELRGVSQGPVATLSLSSPLVSLKSS